MEKWGKIKKSRKSRGFIPSWLMNGFRVRVILHRLRLGYTDTQSTPVWICIRGPRRNSTGMVIVNLACEDSVLDWPNHFWWRKADFQKLVGGVVSHWKLSKFSLRQYHALAWYNKYCGVQSWICWWLGPGYLQSWYKTDVAACFDFSRPILDS